MLLGVRRLEYELSTRRGSSLAMGKQIDAARKEFVKRLEAKSRPAAH